MLAKWYGSLVLFRFCVKMTIIAHCAGGELGEVIGWERSKGQKTGYWVDW